MSKKKCKNIGDRAVECLRKKGFKVNDCRVKNDEQKQLSFEDKVVTRKEFKESAKKADEVMYNAELEVRGTQKFMGVEVPVIEGGFGEGQRCILAKDVANIHDVMSFRINEVINNNLDEFEEGVDILEILGIVSNDTKIAKDLGFSQHSLNSLKGKNGKIYLLSESGYITLCMLMRTDKAKEIRKKFRREYFAMRATLATQSEYIKVLEERNKALEELDKLNACCNIPKSALKKDIKCFMNSLTKEVIFTKVGRRELYEAYRASRRNRPAQPPMSEFEDILFKLNYMQEGDYWLDVVILEDKIRR